MSGFLLGSDALVNTSSAGQLEYNGTSLYFSPTSTQRGVVPGQQLYVLQTSLTGLNSTATQNIFGVGVSLSTSTVYAFEYAVAMSKTAGTTTATINTGFGGTATLNNILYVVQGAGVNSVQMPAALGSDYYVGAVTTASPTAITGTSNSATAYNSWLIKGVVSINAGGTFIPQYTLSAAPGGAWTVLSGSYFLIYPIGAAGANVSIGNWA
jgi:hypothetical protein